MVPCLKSGLAALLPASVSSAVARCDLPEALPAEEEVAVRGAVPSRRREFATGRACARAALGRWDMSQAAIPVGAAGEPRWPEGIVGSITHCEGYRACAVARSTDIPALGIDAEPHRPLPERVLVAVANPEELAQIRRLAEAEPAVCWDRLLFSAKESIFKAWFSLAGRRLGYADASVSFDRDARTFSTVPPGAQVSLPSPPRRLDGRWAVDGGHLLTALVVAQQPSTA